MVHIAIALLQYNSRLHVCIVNAILKIRLYFDRIHVLYVGAHAAILQYYIAIYRGTAVAILQ